MDWDAVSVPSRLEHAADGHVTSGRTPIETSAAKRPVSLECGPADRLDSPARIGVWSS